MLFAKWYLYADKRRFQRQSLKLELQAPLQTAPGMVGEHKRGTNERTLQ